MLVLDMRLCTDVDVALAGHIRLIDSCGTVDARARREIGALDKLHELAHARLGVIH